MKKITLVMALPFLTFALQAQTFPAPYCEIAANGATIEEITSVDLDGTIMTNTDASVLLIDKTSTIVNVAPGDTYVINVAGFTDGNFNNDIVAFIDWNQNDVLDDAGEIYSIGTITNSTGSDGVFATASITVPANAVLGSTRVRITKTYQDSDSPAEINACAIEFYPFGNGPFEGYGQALDFTINIAPLSVESFDMNALSVYPNPAQDVLHINYKSALQAVKVYNLLGQEVLAVTTLESDLKLNVSSLAPGAYIVKLTTEEGTHSLRVVKQ